MDHGDILQSLETNIREKLRYFALKFNMMETHDIGGVSVVDTGIPSNTLNTAYGGEISKSTAEEVYDYYHENDQPMSLWVGPNSTSEDDKCELEETGFQCEDHEIGMACNLQNIPVGYTKPPELVIRQCFNSRQFKDFGKVLASVTDLEDDQVDLFYELVANLKPEDREEIIFFVGYVKKVPVATSCLFLTNVAGVYDLATKPNERNKGYGTALFYHALEEARRRGYETSVLQATVDGLNIYEKFGFQKVCDFNVYTLT